MRNGKQNVGCLHPAIFFSFIVPPLLAVGTLTYAFVVGAVPDLLPLWAAIPLGVLLSALWVGVNIASGGADQTDFIVMGYFLFLLGLLLVVGENRRRHYQQEKARAAALRIDLRALPPLQAPTPSAMPTPPIIPPHGR